MVLVAVAEEVAAPVVVGKFEIMRAYVIDVARIEELQTLNDRDELENIFSRANSTIVNGEKVILIRKDKSGRSEKFDEITTQDDLEGYRERVFKYLH